MPLCVPDRNQDGSNSYKWICNKFLANNDYQKNYLRFDLMVFARVHTSTKVLIRIYCSICIKRFCA